jgi:hypothetical protein
MLPSVIYVVLIYYVNKKNVKGTTKIQLMSNFSPTWQNVGFAAPNRKRTPHIKGKKCTQKTYALMQLIFN